MKSSIVTIGNSKYVRIPKALLEESGLNGDVELRAVKDEIKIIAAPKKKSAEKNEYEVSFKHEQSKRLGQP